MSAPLETALTHFVNIQCRPCGELGAVVEINSDAPTGIKTGYAAAFYSNQTFVIDRDDEGAIKIDRVVFHGNE